MTMKLLQEIWGLSRSREGAWIEMNSFINRNALIVSRSREGAWIEINSISYWNEALLVAPVRERGLK